MRQDNKRFFGILHSSVLRGATIPREQGWIYAPEKPVLRSATIKDFNDFRVSYKGYEGDKNYLPFLLSSTKKLVQILIRVDTWRQKKRQKKNFNH